MSATERETSRLLEKTMDTTIRKDESALVEALVQHGVPANEILPSGSTALGVAAFTGSTKVVGILLKNSADPNAPGKSGTCPLEDASLKGFIAIVGMLLDHGATVNQLNSGSGTTALYSAS
jgi:ankyrin repeat protein